jgi:hypothetical protein
MLDPCDPNSMLEENVVNFIPPQLYNLLMWIYGAADKFERDSFVNVSSETKIKILLIA